MASFGRQMDARHFNWTLAITPPSCPRFVSRLSPNLLDENVDSAYHQRDKSDVLWEAQLMSRLLVAFILFAILALPGFAQRHSSGHSTGGTHAHSSARSRS